MDNNQFSSIERKLDLIISLLTLNLTAKKSVQEKVELLASLGIKSTQIAKILGKSKGNVDKVMGRMRKKEKSK